MDQFTKIVLDNARWSGTDSETGQPLYSITHNNLTFEANNTYDLIGMVRRANNINTVEHMEVIRERHGKPASC